MNNKSKKLLTYIGMAIFIFALTLNVRLAVDDTFTLGSELAYGSGSTGGSNTVYTKKVTTTTSSKTTKEEIGGFCYEKTVTTVITTCDPNSGSIQCTAGSNSTTSSKRVDC